MPPARSKFEFMARFYFRKTGSSNFLSKKHKKESTSFSRNSLLVVMVCLGLIVFVVNLLGSHEILKIFRLRRAERWLRTEVARFARGTHGKYLTWRQLHHQNRQFHRQNGGYIDGFTSSGASGGGLKTCTSLPSLPIERTPLGGRTDDGNVVVCWAISI